ncbi:MAG: hypothetical protein U0353_27925 [Sandaracinus sp.]
MSAAASPAIGGVDRAKEEAARAEWRRDAKALARPALLYQGWTLLMITVFDLVITVLEGPSIELMIVLGILSFSAIVGVTIGQALAIARMRGSFLGCMSLLWMTLTCLITAPLTALGPFGGLALAIMFLTPIFVSGGVWSLASSRALFAAWVPVIFGTGAMFAIIENDDGLARFDSGNKWAIWNVTSALILFLTIALLLAYLVSRERHRLHRWRFGSRALLAGSITEKGSARPRLTMLGWLVVIVVGLGLTAGTLVIAPYLFRTGPEEGQGQGQEGQGQEQQGQGQGQQGQGQGQQGQGQGQQGQGQGQQGQGGEEQEGEEGNDFERAAQQLAQTMCPMLIGLLLMAAGASVLVRPVRRLVIIETLRAVPFPVAPTTRIRMGWRLIEIALGDLGIEGGPSLDASELVRRHASKLQALDSELYELLVEAARVRDRITYGLGIEPGTVERFAKDAEKIFVLATNRVELKKEAENVFRDVR